MHGAVGLVGGTEDSKSRTAAGLLNPAAALVVGSFYLADLYTRSPDSFFEDSILTLCFLPAVEMNPRTLWACQSVAFMISARVAPFARAIISRIFAPLLSARGAVALGLAAFLLALASFFGAAALGLAPLAVFWPLGAPFFRVAAFFEAAFAGATGAPCSATAAALSLVSAFVMLFLVILFCACFAHDDSSLRFPRKARQIFG